MLSAGMSTSSWMSKAWAPWVWRMLSWQSHSSLSTAEKDFIPQNFASCHSSKFSLQTISLTQSFCVPQASVQSVSAFSACNFTKPWNTQGKRRPTKGIKYNWAWDWGGMALVLLEEAADILSGIWGATDHFHPHDGFFRSIFHSLSGPFSYSCYLSSSKVIGMEVFLDIYRFFLSSFLCFAYRLK